MSMSQPRKFGSLWRLAGMILLSIAAFVLVYALMQFPGAMLLAFYITHLGISDPAIPAPQELWNFAVRLWFCWSLSGIGLDWPDTGQGGCGSLLGMVDRVLQYTQMAESPPVSMMIYVQLPCLSAACGLLGAVASLATGFSSYARRRREVPTRVEPQE